MNNYYLIKILRFWGNKNPPAECLAGGFILSHAEIAEYAEAYRTKLRRIAIHKILRFLRAKKNYSTTIFLVTPFIFTKYIPRGNSIVALPSISFVRMACPRAFVMVALPVPSMVTRSLAGLG